MADPRAHRGFTLLEILVVTIIIALLASVAMISIGDRALSDRLDTEARRIKEIFALAVDEAALQGTELGFLGTPDGYTFLALKDGRWLPLEDAGALRGRTLGEPFYLQLEVEGRPVAPARTDDPEVKLQPHVLILSSGEVTAFAIAVKARDYAPYYRIEGDALGRLKLERREAS